MSAEISATYQWLAYLEPLLLGLPRVGTAMATLALLPVKVVPRQLRMAVTASLTLAVYPLLTAQLAESNPAIGEWFVLIPKEMLLGAAIGYLMGVVLWAFSTAGAVIDAQIGFDLGQIFDPLNDRPNGPIAAFFSQLAIYLFFAIGGFHVFLSLLSESMFLWPPTSYFPELSPAFRDLSISAGHSVLQLATRIFLPVFGLLLLLELGIGMVNRIAPQVETFYFSQPIKAVMAMLLLALVLAYQADAMRAELSASRGLVDTLDRTLRP